MIMRREREKKERREGENKIEREREGREENLKCQSLNGNTIVGIVVALLG